MKIFKLAIVAFILLIVIVLVVGLFVSPTYTVKRSITVEQPAERVFDYIKQIKKQSEYSAWSSMDSTMEMTYKGVDGTVGFSSAWNSTNSNVGQGVQTIIKIVEGKEVWTQIKFMVPFEATDTAYFKIHALSDNESSVTWGFQGRMNYPKNLLLLFIDMESQLGSAFSSGLKKIKEILESTLYNQDTKEENKVQGEK